MLCSAPGCNYPMSSCPCCMCVLPFSQSVVHPLLRHLCRYSDASVQVISIWPSDGLKVEEQCCWKFWYVKEKPQSASLQRRGKSSCCNEISKRQAEAATAYTKNRWANHLSVKLWRKEMTLCCVLSHLRLQKSFMVTAHGACSTKTKRLLYVCMRV